MSETIGKLKANFYNRHLTNKLINQLTNFQHLSLDDSMNCDIFNPLTVAEDSDLVVE